MQLAFFKYQGTGNDFILIDNRLNNINLSTEQITNLCHRRFGVGADGLMLLKPHPDYDFEMDYYNSDGSGGTMCGNGGRCIVAFAKYIEIIQNTTKFIASDGVHEAEIDSEGLVNLKMIDVEAIDEFKDFSFLHTGSPHYIKFVDDVNQVDVYNEGKEIRYSDTYKQIGTNVNFVSKDKDGIAVRTYERGVENETYSCGTGSVASAIAYYKKFDQSQTSIPVKVMGGKLEISFLPEGKKFNNIYLKGPATLVFEGVIDLL